MKKPLILLDAGHGGLEKGWYVTPGKRKNFAGLKIHEGVLNRAVVNLVSFMLDFEGVKNKIISHAYRDTPLLERVKIVNDLNKEFNCFLVSIHHNAYKLNSVSGSEIFTSRGQTSSDRYAKIFEDQFFSQNVSRRWRGIKEADYIILRWTKCPAILTEFGFMTNAMEFAYISSYKGIEEQSIWLTESIQKVYNEFLTNTKL